MHRPAPHLRGQRDADPRGRPGARRRGRHRRLRIEWRRGQAALLDGISGTVFTAGDNAYPTGAAADFGGCYEPSWGRHKARTRPTPGNHDYDTSGAAPYYAYFGASAGPAGRGYYSYDLGSWHVVSLNSEVDATSTSAQLQWLRDDLAAHPAACTLAYWHTPLFSSGEHGNLPVMQEVWKLLHEKGADVVINGHDHDYERFAPQNPYGQADPSGIREFVVGTGGTSERAFSALRANSEVRNRDTWGVLKLTLHATSYDWQFVPVAGKTFTDSGSGACFDGANPTATPTATPTPLPPGQTQLTFTPAADATVSQANPTTSYATNSQLESVDGSTTAKQAFLCFKVSGIPSGATIGSARLQLYVVNTSTSGGLVNSLTSTTWPESITWSTRPTVDGPRLASLGSVTAGDVVTVDVTSAVTGNGAYSFAISPLAGNTNTVGYSSRDASLIANRPQLIVLALTSPPTATPTPTVVPDNPEPAITGLSPSAVAAGGAAFTLTVTGTNFVDTSTVQWNGASRPTTFVSSTRLTAAIPASDIAVAGTASVTITNPAPGGGTAGPQTFTIAPSPGQNLLLNDGFELDTNGDGRPDSWTSSSRLTRSATPRHGGSYAGKHAATDNSGYTIYQQIDNLIAGQPYSFAGYVNIPATSDTFTFKLEIRWRSASGSTLRTDSVKSYGGSTGAANAGWDLAAASLTAPASTINAQVRMVVSSLNATVFVDDFAFQPGAPPSDATPPAVIGRTPAAGASGVVPGATVSTQFSEAVTGVSGTSFTLTPQGGSTPLAATVGYDAATSTATLAPAGPLVAGTTYVVNLAGAIADLAGNALAPVSWSFTTAAAGGSTFTFGPVADTYVSQGAATTAYSASSNALSVGGSTTAKQTFLRFTVSGLPAGAVVSSAKLRLYVTNDSTSGGIFNRITNDSWAEGITWNTRPAIDGPQVATLGAAALNTTVEVELTGVVTGNGTYSFAITLPSSNTNTLGYATKEASTAANRPQMIITTQ